MRDYSAARGLFGFLAFLGWAAVVIGVIVALVGASAGGSSFRGGVGALAGFLGAMPGIELAITGVLIVAFVQIGRAGIDTAENTQETLAAVKDQLKVMQGKGERFSKPPGAMQTGGTKAARPPPATRTTPRPAAAEPAKPARYEPGAYRPIAADAAQPGPEPTDAAPKELSHRPEPPMPAMAAPVVSAPVMRPEERRELERMGLPPTEETIGHSGHQIRRTEDGFFIGMLRFDGLEPAKAFIDENLAKGDTPSRS